MPITFTSTTPGFVETEGVLSFSSLEDPAKWSGTISNFPSAGCFFDNNYRFYCDPDLGTFVLEGDNIVDPQPIVATSFDCNGGDNGATFSGATFEFSIQCGEEVIPVTAVVG